jgi:aryl sulfotransferase
MKSYFDLDPPAQIYHDAFTDNRRWAAVYPRDDDIIISTPPKAGTTWLQTIVAHLIFRDEVWPAHLHEVSPWVEMPAFPIEPIAEALEKQTHRRFLKSHTARDGVPLLPQTRYIAVGRDGRDGFMSLVNFYRNFSPALLEMINGAPGRRGEPLPPCPDDVHEVLHNWLTRSAMPWEHDGFPFSSYFHHLQSWWEVRSQPNVHLVHYNDLLENPVGEIGMMAGFLGIATSKARLEKIAEATSFGSMHREAEKYSPPPEMLLGGARSFIYKGENGRWRDVFSPEELAQYKQVVARQMTPDAARWMTEGRRAGL